ncbi:PapB/FocB family fimbrial expression transcriptional regulator [Escherichia coli]|uniref:PapB/FocB family fimbrial expression transcriptional regulator n=1 Tax=Escherichia coli TaxID=562 RepID=UPI003D9C5B05
MHSQKIINALRDYLVSGDTRKVSCERHGANISYFSIALGRLFRVSQLVSQLTPYSGCISLSSYSFDFLALFQFSGTKWGKLGANFATTITAHSTWLPVRRSCPQSTCRKFHTPSAQFHAPSGWL